MQTKIGVERIRSWAAKNEKLRSDDIFISANVDEVCSRSRNYNYHHENYNYFLGKLPKKNVFFWDIFPKSVYPPQGFCEIWEYERWNSGQKGRFSGWFGGFGPCLGVSHPTHPHLGEISKKKRFFTPSFNVNVISFGVIFAHMAG